MKKPAGIRNKNLLNIKGKMWRGAVGVDDRNHTKFSSYPLGVRAAIKLLNTYWFKHKLRTVPAILSRWAPVSDSIGSIPGASPNSPIKYSRFVLGRMPWPEELNGKLSLFRSNGDLDDTLELYFLLEAMSRYELGLEADTHYLVLGIKEFRTNG